MELTSRRRRHFTFQTITPYRMEFLNETSSMYRYGYMERLAKKEGTSMLPCPSRSMSNDLATLVKFLFYLYRLATHFPDGPIFPDTPVNACLRVFVRDFCSLSFHCLHQIIRREEVQIRSVECDKICYFFRHYVYTS